MDYQVSMKIPETSHEVLKKISWENIEPGTERVWLYEDKCTPTTSPKAMSDYLKKLEILLTL